MRQDSILKRIELDFGVKVPILDIFVKKFALSEISFTNLGLGLVITDENVSCFLPKIKFNGEKICLTTYAKPSIETINGIEAGLNSIQFRPDFIIALGSGTINDISKYLSHKLGIYYISIPTAASMNGYASATASIIKNGIKQSFNCTQPKMIVCDTDIIYSSPERLTKAGVMDSIACITAQNDWMLSNILLNTEYKPQIFKSLIDATSYLINNDKYDEKFIDALLFHIFASGVGMWFAGSSSPVSGGEHQVCHVFESIITGSKTSINVNNIDFNNKNTSADTNGVSLQGQNLMLHGEVVGLATQSYIKNQSSLLNAELIVQKNFTKQDITNSFPDFDEQKVLKILSKKLPKTITQSNWKDTSLLIQSANPFTAIQDKIVDRLLSLTSVIFDKEQKNTMLECFKISHLSRERLSFLDFDFKA